MSRLKMHYHERQKAKGSELNVKQRHINMSCSCASCLHGLNLANSRQAATQAFQVLQKWCVKPHAVGPGSLFVWTCCTLVGQNQMQ